MTEVTSLDNRDMKGSVKSYRDFLSLFKEDQSGKKSPRVPASIQLEILQNLIMTDNNREYLNYANDIKTVMAKDQVNNVKEGISLFGLRGIHFVEYPMSMLDLQQVIGRATRDCSHKLLPFTEEYWKVNIFHYIVTHEMLTKMVSKDYQNDLIENAINQAQLEMGNVQVGGATNENNIVPENYCANLSLDECEKVDACHIDAQSGACMMVNINDTIQKMTVRYNELNQDFLTLLQLNAIDCNLFKSLDLNNVS